MHRLMFVAALTSIALAQVPSVDSKSAQDPGERPAFRQKEAGADPSDLPPMPKGKSTVIGGMIRGVDHVRDQFILNIFGGKTMKVLFDQRTQVYRDGVRTPLRDLRAGDHVSVETSLDGTAVFARSIHMLSQSPQGECEGQVLKYSPGDGELTVRDVLSGEPIRLRVPAGTVVVRRGDEGSSSAEPAIRDLAAGDLVSVKFQSDNKGHGIAKQIVVLAARGATFVFVGNVVSLDLHSGLLVLVNPQDNKRYEVFLDFAGFPMSRDLHEGSDLAVSANFDGTRYVATGVTINSTPDK